MLAQQIFLVILVLGALPSPGFRLARTQVAKQHCLQVMTLSLMLGLPTVNSSLYKEQLF
jgi:hypothetical protein